jgi:hypothetical protein
LSIFDKVISFTQDKVKENKERAAKEKALENLTKEQLLELAIDHGIPVSKNASKEDMILECAKNKELTVKDIMKKLKTKEKVTKPQIAVSKKAIKKVQTEDVEVEQEIVRTESIKTTIKSKKMSEYEEIILKTLKTFTPIHKRDMKERDIQDQLISKLTVLIPPDKVNWEQRGKSGRADIVVNDKIAIELKLINSPQQLVPLKAQLDEYNKEYKKIFCYMYDERRSIKPQSFKEFEKDLKRYGINAEIILKP